MHIEISIDFEDSRNSPAKLEIKDMINEVKCGCLQLIVEVFIKVMNGLVMILEEDKRFLCLAALLCEQFCLFTNGGAKISTKSYFMSSFYSQCIQQH